MSKVIATIASQQARQQGLRNVIKAIAPQVDELHVYLNDFEAGYPFHELFHRKVILHYAEYGDLADNGKFILEPANYKDAFMFMLDTDIHYPTDYVSKTISLYKEVGLSTAVSYHGALIKQPHNSYYRDREVFPHNHTQPFPRSVHIIGTGCMCVHTSAINYKLTDWLQAPKYMSDIVFSAMCNEAPVRRYVLPHLGIWLSQDVKLARLDSIMLNHKREDTQQTGYVNKIHWWN